MEVNRLIKMNKINAFNQFSFDEEFFKSSSFIGFCEIPSSIFVQTYLEEQTSCSAQKIGDSLKLVNLTSSILNKKLSSISTGEFVKIQLAIQLLRNADTLYFYQFDKYFMEKDLLFFKKLFKKLVNKYEKTIVLVDSDLRFLFDLVDRMVVLEKNAKIIVYEKNDFYNTSLLKNFEVPKIVEFVRYVNKQGKQLEPYINLNELIKAIYREV